jgi:nitroreductase
LLAARGLGLGTVLTTFQARIEDAVRRELALPEDARPVALIPLGYPDADFGPTRRKPIEEVLYWETWGNTAGA